MSSTSSTTTPRNAQPSSTKKQITKFEQAEHVHRQLLYDLMSSIYEYLLVFTSSHQKSSDETGLQANDTHTYTDFRFTPNLESLLIHLNSCLEQIFLNGLRIFKPDKSPDLWRFFDALNWINPNMTVSIGSQNVNSTNASRRIQAPKSSRIRNDKALMWLYENLLTHQVATKLQCLLSDNEHLTHCYDVTLAFFGSRKFIEAFYICLNAFDKNQYDLLLDIDQTLYLSVIHESLANANASTTQSTSVRKRQPLNGRCSEFCDITASASSLKKCDDSLISSKSHVTHRKCRNDRTRCRIKHTIGLRLRRFVSLPDLRKTSRQDIRTRNLTRSRSQLIRAKSHRMKLTVENLALNDRRKMSGNGQSNQTLASHQFDPHNAISHDLQPINLVKCDDIKIYTDRRGDESSTSMNVPSRNVGLVRGGNLLPYLNTSHNTASTESNSSPAKKQTSNSAPGDFASFFAANGAKIENRYHQQTLLDPIESNTSLLPLCDHDHCALIPNRGQSLTSYLQEAQRTRRNITDLERENRHFSLSDAIISAIEEIKCSRMEQKKEKQCKASSTQRKKRKTHQRPLRNWNLGDDERGMNANVTDDDASSFMSESITTISRSSSSSSDSDLSRISNTSDSSTPSNAGDMKRLKAFSISSHSINDSHTAFAEWAESSTETLSAEGIALSLISKFKDCQLPQAVDLFSNAAENPMYSMVDRATQDQIPYTRGTPDWAPPRAQIIFTRHPVPDRRNILQQQNNRCAGCGMHIDAAYVYSLRYCEYSGKYHCTGCHRNQISAIPARALHNWDFSCHPVSVFSYRLLDQIWKVPLFRIPDLNKELYAHVRTLRYCRYLRMQLNYVHDFIQTCRFVDDDKVKNEFDSIQSYTYDDIDNWSMNDLVNVRNGTFLVKINTIIQTCETHVFNCELCTAHGFICEHCTDKKVIFPWQAKVIRCAKCGSCAHIQCSKNPCLKCQRLEKRNQNP